MVDVSSDAPLPTARWFMLGAISSLLTAQLMNRTSISLLAPHTGQFNI
jgi:hypothetical protein